MTSTTRRDLTAETPHVETRGLAETAVHTASLATRYTVMHNVYEGTLGEAGPGRNVYLTLTQEGKTITLMPEQAREIYDALTEHYEMDV